MCRGERPFPLPVWHSWLSGSTSSLAAARFFFLLLSLCLFLLVLIPMTWQKWDTSRLQVKGPVGFDSVFMEDLEPSRDVPWFFRFIILEWSPFDVSAMSFSRFFPGKATALDTAFWQRGFAGMGGCKKPFLEPLHLTCWKFFCSFWLGALGLFGCQDLPLELGTHHCVQVAYEQKLLTQEEQSNWAVTTSLLIVVVVFRSRSILGHENGDSWLVNWCQCCACFPVMQANYHWFKRLLVLLLLVQDQRTPRRIQAGQLALMTLSQTGNRTTCTEDGVEDSWYLWFIAWSEGKSTFENPKWAQKYSLPFRRLRYCWSVCGCMTNSPNICVRHT